MSTHETHNELLLRRVTIAIARVEQEIKDRELALERYIRKEAELQGRVDR